MIDDWRIAKSHGIAGSCDTQLRYGTNISRTKLRNLNGLLSTQYVDLSDLFVCFFMDVVDFGIWLHGTSAYLKKRILSEERIYDGLPYLCSQRCIGIVLCGEALPVGYIHAYGFEFIR